MDVINEAKEMASALMAANNQRVMASAIIMWWHG